LVVTSLREKNQTYPVYRHSSPCIILIHEKFIAIFATVYLVENTISEIFLNGIRNTAKSCTRTEIFKPPSVFPKFLIEFKKEDLYGNFFVT